jgi:hypothetical protein
MRRIEVRPLIYDRIMLGGGLGSDLDHRSAVVGILLRPKWKNEGALSREEKTFHFTKLRTGREIVKGRQLSERSGAK